MLLFAENVFHQNVPCFSSLHREEMEERYYLIMPFGPKGQPGPGIGARTEGGRSRGGVDFEKVCGGVADSPIGYQVLMLRLFP